MRLFNRKGLNELREQRVQELMNEADKVQDDALELLAKLDGTTVEEQREKLAEAAGEIGKTGTIKHWFWR